MNITKAEMLDVLKSVGKYAPEAYENMNEERLQQEYQRLMDSQTNRN